MKLIKPSFEVLPTSITTILKDIEKTARTCYKSEDKISEDDSSAIKRYKDLVDKTHKAMLEFGENFVFLKKSDVLFFG